MRFTFEELEKTIYVSGIIAKYLVFAEYSSLAKLTR